MNKLERADTRSREELLGLLSISGTMAGLCIMGVTLIYTMGKTVEETVVNDVLVICAMLFLLCTYLVFLAMRTTSANVATLLGRLTDALFAAALTGMVIAGFAMVYTVW
jgi:hypothetical protein